MNNYDAIAITLGFKKVDTHEEDAEAWQTLIDTGLVWKLSSKYIKTAKRLIEIEAKIKNDE
jgi:hypothetical protein|tara:strand:+ start:1762 stop:1944 length:183 start_codon:yes stop_codon:yes gene_type:complete